MHWGLGALLQWTVAAAVVVLAPWVNRCLEGLLEPHFARRCLFAHSPTPQWTPRLVWSPWPRVLCSPPPEAIAAAEAEAEAWERYRR